MASKTTVINAATTSIKQPVFSRDENPRQHRAHDFFWTDQEEPHRTRRIQIIKAHPEVTKLCGPEPWTKFVVVFVLTIQILCAISLRNTTILSIRFLLTTYIVGATANQNLFLAIHELSHNLAFKSPLLNRLFAVVANLPIGAPYSAAFRVSRPA